MPRLVELSSKWRHTAEEFDRYANGSDGAAALKACAEELEQALENDLDTWVPIEIASRLSGRTKSDLRRYARSAHGNTDAPIAVRKNGSGRWLFLSL